MVFITDTVRIQRKFSRTGVGRNSSKKSLEHKRSQEELPNVTHLCYGLNMVGIQTIKFVTAFFFK